METSTRKRGGAVGREYLHGRRCRRVVVGAVVAVAARDSEPQDDLFRPRASWV